MKNNPYETPHCRLRVVKNIAAQTINLFERIKIYIIAQDLGYKKLKGLNLILFRHGII